MPILKLKGHIKKLKNLLGNSQIDLWFVDEVHFQLHGSRCQMWIPPEDIDPIYLHCPVKKSVGYFGAVRVRDGKFISKRVHDTFNAETFWDFMRHLHVHSSRGSRKVIVVLDNARYHHATLHKKWRLIVESRFALDFLPAYSPKLNVIERVWKLPRRLGTHNTCFESTDEIAHAVETQFEVWSSPNKVLKKLCAII